MGIINNRRTMVTVIVLLGTLLLGVGMVSAAKSKLEMWVYDSPNFLQAIDVYKQEFEKMNPDIEVVISTLQWDNITDKTAVAIASGTTPDVFLIQSQDGMPFARKGGFEPLPPPLAARVERDYLEGPKGLVTHAGKIYAVPNNIEIDAAPILTIDRDAWDAAGVATPLNTWEDMLAAFRRLTQRDQNGIITKAAVSFLRGAQGEFFNTMLLWHGGRMFAEDGQTPLFNSSQGLKTLETITDLYQNFEAPFRTYPGNVFRSREALSVWGFGPFFSEGILTKNLGIAVDHVRVPLIEPGITQNWITHAVWAWWVPANKGSDNAWKWIEYVMSRDAERTWTLTTGEFPADKAMLRTPAVMERQSMLAYLPVVPLALQSGFVGDVLQEEKILAKMVEDVAQKKTPPQQAIAEAAQSITNLFR